jgi:hypothetical protein
MKAPTSRDVFGTWLNEQGLLGTGVEVGCGFGHFSKLLMGQWKGARHFMVDPWERQPDAVYRENTNHEADFERWYQQCQEVAANDPRIVLVRKYSVDAAKDFNNAELDFVYIDGNHAYGPVLEDMDAWWPKVKRGGIVGGHDFYNYTVYPYFNEVKSAVERWTTERSLDFTHTPACSSWWILK